jgi:DNA-binding NtrC family response regulator
MEASESAAGNKSLRSLIQDVKCEAERNAIAAALEKTGWNRKAAARLLKVSYRTMLYKIEQYHMNSPDPYASPVLEGNGLRGNGHGWKGNGKTG